MNTLSSEDLRAISGGFSLIADPQLEKIIDEYALYYARLGTSVGTVYGVVQAGSIFDNSNVILDHTIYGCGLGYFVGSTIGWLTGLQNNDS